MTPRDAAGFIASHTVLGRAPLVPEFQLYLASEITPIWQATEDFLARHNLAPPFWAFAWPGSQLLARWVLDRPALVAGRRVLDFACGGGLAALAAARAGAVCVEAAEIDPMAIAALEMNARVNGVVVTGLVADMVGRPRAWDVILCGDVCYEAPMTGHILPWLRRMAAEGALVLLADPGRAYLPKDGLAEMARATIPTSLELEDRMQRETRLYRVEGR